ncbi:MAG: helix-turn-helix domain-containing protein [Breznakibacter sp.]
MQKWIVFDTWFDEDKLGKILFNLLSNAFKYTSGQGSVSVQVEKGIQREKPVWRITIRDTGIGIADGDKENVFDEFFRAKNTRPFEGQSSGIGLAFTRKLVDLLNGTIEIGDNQPQGTKFTVAIPFLPVAGAGADDNMHQAVSDDNERPVVLVVDDNADLRNYLAGALGYHYSVLPASNGKDGLAMATAEIPDVVVSDVMMPVMDGFELCSRVKSDERTCHIPVILLTAMVDDEAKITGYEKGADIYHAKPFNVRLLLSQIKSLIDNRQKLRRAFAGDASAGTADMAVRCIDDAFVKKALAFVEANLERTDFSQEELADHLSVSKRQLYRKIDALTGQTLHEFITSIRMDRAKTLLTQGNLNVSEVAYRVGFTEPSNFSRTFSKHFGKNPSHFLKN